MTTIFYTLFALYYFLSPSPSPTSERVTLQVKLSETLQVDDMTDDQYAGLNRCLDRGQCATVTAGNVVLFMDLATNKVIAWMPAQDPKVSGDTGLHQ